MAFENALSRAYEAAKHDLLERVKSRIAHAAPLLNRSQTAVSP
jgi:glycerol-3-phosphate acyltransferase PlsX